MTVPLFCYGIPLLFPTLHFLKKNRLIGSMLVVAGIFYELVDCLLLHKEIIKQKEWRRKQKRLKNGKSVTLPTHFFFQGLCLYTERSTFLTPSYRFTHGWQGYVISCGIYVALSTPRCVTWPCVLLHEYLCVTETSCWRRYVRRPLSL